MIQPKGDRASLDNWTIIKNLGRGGYCKVKLGKDHKTGQEVALKIVLDNHNIERNIKSVTQELSAMGKMDHPNILHTFTCKSDGVYTSKDGGIKSNIFYTALELASHGEIFEY